MTDSQEPEPRPLATAPESAPTDDASSGESFWQRWRWRSLGLLAVLAVGVLIVRYVDSWYRRGDPSAAVDADGLGDPDQPDRDRPPQLLWTDVTATVGITFRHFTGANGEKLLPEALGGGVAIFDFDRDGDADLFFSNGDRWPWDAEGEPAEPRPTPSLWANDGQGHFREVTAEAGLALSFYGQGATAGDYDGDGWVDLYCTAVGKNHLFRNVEGKFVDVTAERHVAGPDDAWSTAACWLDYDRDGDLDLFVGNYVRWSRELDQAQGQQLPGLGRSYGPAVGFEGTQPLLFRNDGAAGFAEVAAPAGLVVRHPPSARPMAKVRGVLPTDLDGDGWIDLVVANDSVPNFLFKNGQNGTFRELGTRSGLDLDPKGHPRAAMGIDATWLRRDQVPTIVIGNGPLEMTALFVRQGSPLKFADEALPAGLGTATRQVTTAGVLFADFDLDGRDDLLLANGHLEPEIARVQSNQTYAQPPKLFWNAGPLAEREFVAWSAAEAGDELFVPLVGRGAATGDLDGDGDLDLVLATAGGTPRVLRNEQTLGHHWVRLKLMGRAPNRDALGARVELTAGGRRQVDEVRSTRGYLSQSELALTFGLGRATRIDKLLIRWPDGSEQTVSELPIDRTSEIEQGR